jgi:UDP-N-acetylglucosamine transferase subunit ALG13
MGSIISAIEAGKPILMLPRLESRGEHNTDHQLATAKHVGVRPGLHVAADEADLKARATALIGDAHKADRLAPAPISRFADPDFTARIRAFIES